MYLDYIAEVEESAAIDNSTEFFNCDCAYIFCWYVLVRVERVELDSNMGSVCCGVQLYDIEFGVAYGDAVCACNAVYDYTSVE